MAWDDNKSAGDLIQSSEWNSMVTDQKGRIIGTSVSEAIADTSANRPAAGTSGRLFFETDTGRTLYDDGSSWIEVGLSESKISLANLGSNSYADLSDGSSFPIPNTDLNNSSLTVANTNISLGGSGTPEADNLGGNNGTSGQVLQTDGTNASWADVSAGGKFEDALANGQVLADDGNLYSTIQTAENNASDYIFIGKGTFSETVTVTTSGLTVIGTGRGSLIDGGSGSSALVIDAPNVKIRDIAVKSTGTGGFQADVLRLETNADNIEIESIRVLDSGAVGIYLRNGTNHKVTECVIEDSYGNAIGGSQPDAVISNNTILNTQSGRGIAVQNNWTVTGNFIQSVSSSGMRVNANATIKGNVVRNASDSGITIVGDDAICVGNRVIGSTNDGINLLANDCIVTNNRVTGSGGSGVSNSGTGGAVNNNITGDPN